MIRTEPALYVVVGRQRNHLWLEVLEGDDQGIRVSVPVHDSAYESDDLASEIRDLSAGDIGQFVLESDDEGYPEWRIAEIHELRDDRDSILA